MTKKEECYKIFAENDTKSRGYVIGLVVENVGVTQTTAQTYYPAWRNEYKNKPGYVAPPKHGMQEKVNNITETPHHITQLTKNNTKVDEKSTFHAFDVSESKPVDVINKTSIPDIDIKKIVSNAFAEAKEKFHENNEKTFDEAKECATIRNEKLIGEVKEIINSKGEGINWKADVINPIKTEKGKEDIFEITKLIPVVMEGKYGEYRFFKAGVKNTSNEDFISKDKLDEELEALEIWERCYGKEGVHTC